MHSEEVKRAIETILSLKECQALDSIPFPHLKETLTILQEQGIKLAVCTNADIPEEKYNVMEKLGILHFFDQLVISGSEGVRKPTPEILKPILSAPGWSDMQPWEIAFVGDMLDRDIAMAHSVGLRTVWMKAREYHKEVNTKMLEKGWGIE